MPKSVASDMLNVVNAIGGEFGVTFSKDKSKVLIVNIYVMKKLEGTGYWAILKWNRLGSINTLAFGLMKVGAKER